MPHRSADRSSARATHATPNPAGAFDRPSPPAPAEDRPIQLPAAASAIGSEVVALRHALLAWYDRTGRTLPFRGATDPWAILVSEAMAQQTQAARAGEAWTAFMRVYPDPGALADATPAAVLRAWRGLGYNRRALALRAAAIVIVADHGGRVPDDIEALERLPGVGPYTSRAVAALAFGRPVAAVDTNVRRVVARLAGSPVPASPRELQRLADALVDPDRPGDWTHALMDIGATHCRGPNPDHAACPLAPWCRTARETTDDRRPAVEARAGASRGPGPTSRGRRQGPKAAEAAAPLSSTSRWLRGRLVDRLRDAPDGAWVRLDGTFGDHAPGAVERAIEGLERDGLLERHPEQTALVRLPVVVSPGRAAR